MGCVDNRANSFLALSQRVFGLLAVGDVARHFRKATEASRLVAHGRDDHIGPEPRPIFAHSPALVFQPTLARCHSQLLLRSEEHTSELQSRENLVCRLLLEKKKKKAHK